MATLQKLLLSRPISVLQSRRDTERTFYLKERPNVRKKLISSAYAYMSNGENILLTLQEKDSALNEPLRTRQLSGAEIESKCEMSNSCMQCH